MSTGLESTTLDVARTSVKTHLKIMSTFQLVLEKMFSASGLLLTKCLNKREPILKTKEHVMKKIIISSESNADFFWNRPNCHGSPFY